MATKLEIYNLALIGIGASSVTDAELTAASIKQVKTLDAIYTFCRDEVLAGYGWKFAKKTTPLVLIDGFAVDEDEVTITGATQANPIVITATNTYSDEDIIKIADIAGMTELNGNIYEIDNVSATDFELKGIDGTGFDAYASDGECIRYEAIAEYSGGFTYALPEDCIKPRKLDNSTFDFEIRGETLLTVVENAVLEYTKKVTDESLFSATFLLTLAARLGAGVCLSLVGNKSSIIQFAWENYYATMARQSSIDAQSQTKRRHKYIDSWETGRL